MPVLGLLSMGQPRLRSHGGIHLLHQKCIRRIVEAHLHGFDIGLTETGVLEQDIQIELRYRALGKGHRLPPEIGDGPNVIAGDDAVTAERLIDRQHADIGSFRVEIRQHVVDRD